MTTIVWGGFMAAEIKTTTEPQVDLKKPGTEASLRSARMASVEFATGVADAVALGWRSFRDELASSNQWLDTSLLSGSVQAAATFLEGVASATRKSYQQFESRTRQAAAPEIDYDRLAKLVAAELRKTPS